MRQTTWKIQIYLDQSWEKKGYKKGSACCIIHRKIIKGVNPKSSHHKEECYFPSFLSYLYEAMDVSPTHCGHHFMIHVNQIIMLYALDVYNEVCQLFLSNTGKKRKCGVVQLQVLGA